MNYRKLMRRLKWCAIGVGLCPFDWRLGDVSLGWWDDQWMWSLGPVRLSVRWGR